MANDILNGIRVADMTTVIFGPYCTQILGDLGADVIKIEPSGGDASRNIGRSAATPLMGGLHMRMNRGKRSVDWDLKNPRQYAAFEALIRTSDIFIHNLLPGAIERAKVDYESVRALRPDIIYVHCTGFDSRGPRAGLPAYDDVIQAASGVASLLPLVDGDPAPRFFPMAVADKVSALHSAYAVLAAIIHRLRTGEGQFVEVPMLESMVSFNLLDHLYESTFVPPIGEMGYARQIDPTRQPMRTKDGYIVVAPYQDARWIRLMHLIDRGDILEEPGLQDLMSRRENVSRMHVALAEALPRQTSSTWLTVFQENGIPATAVKDLPSLLDDEQLRASCLIHEREHPSEGGYLELGPPVLFSACSETLPRPAPLLGEHSRSVAEELGVALE